MRTTIQFPNTDRMALLLEHKGISPRPSKHRFYQMAADRIQDLAFTRPYITADDIWETVPKPAEPRWLGTALRRAQSAGLIRRTDYTRDSSQGSNHGRPVRVWESLVCC